MLIHHFNKLWCHQFKCLLLMLLIIFLQFFIKLINELILKTMGISQLDLRYLLQLFCLFSRDCWEFREVSSVWCKFSLSSIKQISRKSFDTVPICNSCSITWAANMICSNKESQIKNSWVKWDKHREIIHQMGHTHWKQVVLKLTALCKMTKKKTMQIWIKRLKKCKMVKS